VPYGIYADLREPADDSTVAFMDAFLDAYFLGDGRLPRMITAAADIDPPRQTATEVRLGSVARGVIDGATWVTATATVTDAGGNTLPTAITAHLTADTSGAIRVAEVLAGPPPLPRAP
jgi:hypothetical protein